MDLSFTRWSMPFVVLAASLALVGLAPLRPASAADEMMKSDAPVPAAEPRRPEAAKPAQPKKPEPARPEGDKVAAVTKPDAKSPQAKKTPEAKRPVGRKREGNWLTAYNLAVVQAKKQNKPILAYFRGSDWCDYCKKLDKEVLSTDLFLDWAEKSVILLDVDFPAEKRQPHAIKRQNETLKDRYSVAKTPTFLFMDADGEVITRAGYDTAKLRESEAKGQPKAWVDFAANVITNRPAQQALRTQTDLEAGMKYARTHAFPMVLLLTEKDKPEVAEQAQKLMSVQKFVRFVNTHMSFVHLDWPQDDDNALPTLEFLAWAHKQKVPQLPLQLVVWDPHKSVVTARITSINTDKIDPVLIRLRDELPNFDYTGRWIEDFRLAQSISAQTNRDILLSFTGMDSSEWSKKIDAEIYQQETFKDYARKNLVLVRIDFPKDPALQAKQSAAIKEQNRLLAEAYAIRGYPTVLFINPRGQKFGEAKYMKGGPPVFIKALDDLRRADYERRTILSDQFGPWNLDGPAKK